MRINTLSTQEFNSFSEYPDYNQISVEYME